MSIELLSSCAVQSLSPSIEIRHETAQVQEVVRVLAALNQSQRLRVLDALRPAAGLHALLALIEHWRGPGRRCPHWRCPGWQRYGQANGLQRYRCRQCRRTFNDLTGTPLARLRLRAQWRDFLDTLLASRPVRAAEAALLKVIDTPSTTASAWRQIFVVLIMDITN